MIITNVNDGKKAGFSVSGTVLTIREVSVDLQERQRSTERVIDVCLDNQLQTMREGMGAWYVATVIIPAKQTELYDTGKKDEEGDAVYAERDRGLDMGKVELKLWALPEEYGESKPEEGAEA
ncbi:AAA family ATPase [Halobacillus trueperi]|uniref:AAA family ATPase n=1 Tax=Halobacillus trueperi TaxID=156205 RepID=A0A3D8VM21_9BACI|nr:AAA family ATPase [Halobacillus trueperi]RDY70333.1 AAA family ATPase [Halobacillus trueperi]